MFFSRNITSQGGVEENTQSTEWKEKWTKDNTSSKAYFRYDGEIKDFPGKQKLSEFTTPRPVFLKNVERSSSTGNKKTKVDKTLRNTTSRQTEAAGNCNSTS